MKSTRGLAASLLLLGAACSNPTPDAGSGSAPPPDTGPASEPCEEDAACQASSPCARGLCRSGRCIEVPIDGACDDGDPCTEGDRCVDGDCSPGAPKRCSASASCRVARCDPSSGACVETEAPDGTLCSDQDGCTAGESCRDGACVGGVPLVCPLTDCMIANVCDPAQSRCVPVLAPDGTPCSDDNVCTEGDACEAGRCEPGAPAERTPRCSEGLCFTELAEALGLDYAPNPVFDVEGAGAAVADFDGDGWMDVVLFQEATQPRLYRNLQGAGFSDVSEAWGLEVDFESLLLIQGLAAGDLDEDGHPDLVMVGEGSNTIFWNEGARFTVDEGSIADAPRWGVSATLGDADNDGDLDVLVGNYIRPPSSFPAHNPEVNTLFRNDGDRNFVDISQEAGLREGPQGTTYAIAFTDFDGDGVQDIVECNDFGQYVQPNRWFRGRLEEGAPRYEEVGAQLGADVAFYCMTVSKGDFDRDGDLDYYHTNIGRHALLRNDGDRFVDVAGTLGVEAAEDACFTRLKSAGWGAGFRDFDLDGWPDLFATAGWVPSAPMDENPRESENTLFHRVDGRFVDVAQSSGVASTARSKGVVFFDYDRDGDVDILVANMIRGPELYRNDSPRRGRWLELGFRGRASNRDGFGARVLADFGRFELLEEHQPHGSYASASEPRLHFGAGAAERARLQVMWPSGLRQELEVATDADHVLIEPVLTLERVTVDGGQVEVLVRRRGGAEGRLLFLGADDGVLEEHPVTDDLLQASIPAEAVRVRVEDQGGGRDERPL